MAAYTSKLCDRWTREAIHVCHTVAVRPPRL